MPRMSSIRVKSIKKGMNLVEFDSHLRGCIKSTAQEDAQPMSNDSWRCKTLVTENLTYFGAREGEYVNLIESPMCLLNLNLIEEGIEDARHDSVFK